MHAHLIEVELVNTLLRCHSTQQRALSHNRAAKYSIFMLV